MAHFGISPRNYRKNVRGELTGKPSLLAAIGADVYGQPPRTKDTSLDGSIYSCRRVKLHRRSLHAMHRFFSRPKSVGHKASIYHSGGVAVALLVRTTCDRISNQCNFATSLDDVAQVGLQTDVATGPAMITFSIFRIRNCLITSLDSHPNCSCGDVLQV